MMFQRWIRSGPNWMWATWLGDTQIVYLLQRNPLSLSEDWAVMRKVSGAADRHGHVIGNSTHLNTAKQIAETDADQPL